MSRAEFNAYVATSLTHMTIEQLYEYINPMRSIRNVGSSSKNMNNQRINKTKQTLKTQYKKFLNDRLNAMEHGTSFNVTGKNTFMRAYRAASTASFKFIRERPNKPTVVRFLKNKGYSNTEIELALNNWN
jgi:hypothetical protein